MSTPNAPANVQESSEGYEEFSTDPSEYEGKSVLILGRGNSAFETAQGIYGVTNLVHMVSRSRIRNAYQTHYVGDLRALNNELLDTYQLKSLDGFLDIDVNDISLIKIDDKYYLSDPRTNQTDPRINSRVGYDKVKKKRKIFEYFIFLRHSKITTRCSDAWDSNLTKAYLKACIILLSRLIENIRI